MDAGTVRFPKLLLVRRLPSLPDTDAGPDQLLRLVLAMSTPFSLRTFRGGLNNRDLPSALAADECPVLENYYTDNNDLLTKRGGMQLLQYAPPNPSTFAADANTLALYHFDSVSFYGQDSSGNGYDLSISVNPPPSVIPSLFDNGISIAPLSQTSDGNSLENGHVRLLDGLNAVTIEAWVNIPPDVYGGDITVTRPFFNMPKNYTLAVANGAPLFSTYGGGGGVGVLVNGITYQSGVNPLTGRNEAFLQAVLNTNGIPGTVTTLTTNPLATNTWLHIKLTYDGNTGLMQLFISGNLESQAYVLGAGTINDTISSGGWVVGGFSPFGYEYQSGILHTTFPGIIDEMRISNVVRTVFPFFQLRGKGFEYWNSNGTHQFLVSAQSGLFFNTGSGAWTPMVNAPNNSGVFQYNAAQPNYWDMVQLGDFMYLSDGLNYPQCWDGQTLVDWGNPSVPLNLSLAVETGPTAGTTRMVYTFLYGDYETGISPVATIANPSGNQVNVAQIPWRHSNCTGIRFYVQQQGSSTWYLWRQIDNIPGTAQNISGPYEAGSPAGYQTDSGAYGVPDSDLGASGYPAISADAFAAVTYLWKYLVVQGRRMLACGQSNEPYNARWSELDNPDVWNAYNFTVGNSGKGPLNGMGLYYGDTVFSKSGEAMLVLRGTDPSNWQEFELLHPTVGCLDHWGFVHHFPTVPPGDDPAGNQSSDRYVLVFPGTDGFYTYEGQDLQKVSDKINPTYATITQTTSNKLDWIIDSEAGFESNLTQGGSATSNVQQNQYEEDGIRQTVGQLGPFNQLNYLGLWSAANPLAPGRVIALCPNGVDGQFYFSTDYDGTLYFTPDNFLTVQKFTNAAFGAYERIIEITLGGIFLLCITDTQNIPGITNGSALATVTGAVSANSGETPIGLSTTAGFVGLNTPGNVQSQFVDVYSAPTGPPITTGIQQPLIANLDVVLVNSNIVVTASSIPVNIPINSIITYPGQGSQSGGGFAYLFNTISNSWTYKSATQLFYDLDVPVFRQTDTSTQGLGGFDVAQQQIDQNFVYGGLVGIGQGAQGTWPNSAFNVWLNHAQRCLFAYGSGNFRNSNNAAVGNFIFPFWPQMVPTLDGISNINWENNAPGTYGLGNYSFDLLPFNATQPYSLYMQPGFWNAFTYALVTATNTSGSIAQAGTFFFWWMYTRRMGPQWLGGTHRPQAIFDSPNQRFVFLGSTAEDANGNRNSEIWTLTPPNTLTPWVYGESGVIFTGNCVSAITTDGTNLYFAYYAAPSSTSSDPFISSAGCRFNIGSSVLNTLGVFAWKNGNLVPNQVPLRMGYDPTTKLILWSSQDFNQEQQYPASGGQNWYGFASSLSVIPATANGANINLTPNETTMFNPLSQLTTAFYCELARQTDTPDAWIIGCNQPDGITPALSLLEQPLNATTDLTTLKGAPYTGNGLATGPGTGILSPIVFAASTGAPNYTWADRVYFSTTAENPNDSRMVQLGIPGDWTVQGQYIGPYNNLGAFAAFDTVTTDENGSYALYLRNAATVAGLAGNELQVGNGAPITSNLFTPPAIYAQWRIVWTWVYSPANPALPPSLTFVDVGYFVGYIISLPRITGISYLGRSYWSVATSQQEQNNLVIVYQKTRTWMLIKNWSLAGISIFQNNLVAIMAYGWVQLESGGDDLGALIVGRARTSTFMSPAYIGANEQPAYAQTLHAMGLVDKLISSMQANVQSFINQAIANQNAWLIITPYVGETPLPNSAWALPIPAASLVETLRVRAKPYARFGYDWARSFSMMIETSQDTSGAYVAVLDVPEVVQTIDLELDLTEPSYNIPVQ